MTINLLSKKYLKSLAGILAGFFIVQNAVLIHAAETNMWAERRKAVLSNENALPTHDTAANWPGLMADDLGADPAKLLASLPKLQSTIAVPFSSKALHDLGINPSLGSEKKGALISRHLPEWIPTSIAPYATIQEIHLSKNPQAKTVLLMQDAHMHYEAQTNIAGAMDALARAMPRHGVAKGEAGSSSLLVGLEGADISYIDFSVFNPYTNRPLLRDVAQAFLKLNVLNGVEFAAIGYLGEENGSQGQTLTRPFEITGIEKQSEYNANVKALRDSVPGKEKMKMGLASYRTALQELKNRHYNSELIKYDAKMSAFESGELPLPDYVLYLDSIQQATRPHLRQLISAVLLEGSIDFTQVEKERAQILETLINKMSEEETQTLLQYSALYRANRLSYTAYYDHLKALAERYGVSFTRYPEMNLYVQYVLKSEGIDGNLLLSELKNLESEVQNKLALTKAQQGVLALSKDYFLLSKLSDHILTEDEWHVYESRRGEIAKLSDRFFDLDSELPEHMKGLEIYLSILEAFYNSAVARNHTMADKLVKAMNSSQFTVHRNLEFALLVAGGFHTQGLLKELKKHNVHVLVLSPKITQLEEGGVSSLDVLTSGQMPLDRLFVGEKLFIPVAPQTAGNLRGMARAMGGVYQAAETGKPTTVGDVRVRPVSESHAGKPGALTVRGQTFSLGKKRAAFISSNLLYVLILTFFIAMPIVFCILTGLGLIDVQILIVFMGILVAVEMSIFSIYKLNSIIRTWKARSDIPRRIDRSRVDRIVGPDDRDSGKTDNPSQTRNPPRNNWPMGLFLFLALLIPGLSNNLSAQVPAKEAPNRPVAVQSEDSSSPLNVRFNLKDKVGEQIVEHGWHYRLSKKESDIIKRNPTRNIEFTVHPQNEGDVIEGGHFEIKTTGPDGEIAEIFGIVVYTENGELIVKRDDPSRANPNPTKATARREGDGLVVVVPYSEVASFLQNPDNPIRSLNNWTGGTSTNISHAPAEKTRINTSDIPNKGSARIVSFEEKKEEKKVVPDLKSSSEEISWPAVIVVSIIGLLIFLGWYFSPKTSHPNYQDMWMFFIVFSLSSAGVAQAGVGSAVAAAVPYGLLFGIPALLIGRKLLRINGQRHSAAKVLTPVELKQPDSGNPYAQHIPDEEDDDDGEAEDAIADGVPNELVAASFFSINPMLALLNSVLDRGSIDNLIRKLQKKADEILKEGGGRQAERSNQLTGYNLVIQFLDVLKGLYGPKSTFGHSYIEKFINAGATTCLPFFSSLQLADLFIDAAGLRQHRPDENAPANQRLREITQLFGINLRLVLLLPRDKRVRDRHDMDQLVFVERDPENSGGFVVRTTDEAVNEVYQERLNSFFRLEESLSVQLGSDIIELLAFETLVLKEIGRALGIPDQDLLEAGFGPNDKISDKAKANPSFNFLAMLGALQEKALGKPAEQRFPKTMPDPVTQEAVSPHEYKKQQVATVTALAETRPILRGLFPGQGAVRNYNLLGAKNPRYDSPRTVEFSGQDSTITQQSLEVLQATPRLVNLFKAMVAAIQAGWKFVLAEQVETDPRVQLGQVTSLPVFDGTNDPSYFVKAYIERKFGLHSRSTAIAYMGTKEQLGAILEDYRNYLIAQRSKVDDEIMDLEILLNRTESTIQDLEDGTMKLIIPTQHPEEVEGQPGVFDVTKVAQGIQEQANSLNLGIQRIVFLSDSRRLISQQIDIAIASVLYISGFVSIEGRFKNEIYATIFA